MSGKNLSERGKTPMSEVKFKIFCDNVECKDCGKEVNEITFEDISEEEQQAELDEENFMEMDDGA